MQHQRDTEHVNVTQVEARADRRRASTTESGALPSSQASLFEFASSGKPAVLSKQTPSQKQATSEREKPEDLELVLEGERRRTEQQVIGGIRAAAVSDTADICTAVAAVATSEGDGAARRGGGIRGSATAKATSTAVTAPRSKAREKRKNSVKTKHWNTRHHRCRRCRRLREFQCRLTGACAEGTHFSCEVGAFLLLSERYTQNAGRGWR